jgi:protein TonB
MTLPMVFSIVGHAGAAATALAFMSAGRRTQAPAGEPAAVEVTLADEVPEVAPAAAAPALQSAALPAARRPLVRARPQRSLSLTAPTIDAPVASPHSAAPEAAPARFAMRLTTVVATLPGEISEVGVARRTAATAARSGTDGEAIAEALVDRPARLLAATPVVYPAAARRAEIEVDLRLEIVVEPDGTVRVARLLSPAGYGLDEAALAAIRGYQFSPAVREGRPVRVRMRWTVQFRLH